MLKSTVKFQQNLLRWYTTHRRDLPWRQKHNGKLDPYIVLVSETMLQQTQVATVIPFFKRFLKIFPTVAALAKADEQAVLRTWQGLGYYSRARNLRAAAKRICEQDDGTVPESVEKLLELPGVGRYTAGAVASIAFDRRAPILDGNVTRVLCRLDRIEDDPRDPAVREQLWKRAEQILPQRRCGDFNSALMELGATVCTPRSPKCLLCPVAANCEARKAGVQERIPPPRETRITPLHRRVVLCIRKGDEFLIEQRPPRGRWAGMWQFVTLDAKEMKRPATLGKHLTMQLHPPRRVGRLQHALTHRRYEFDVYAAEVHRDGTDLSPRRWMTLEQLDKVPLPRPHVKVVEMLKSR